MSFKKFNPKKPKKHESTRCDKIVNYEATPKYGFHGFRLYFINDPNNIEAIIKNTRTFQKYISRNSESFPLCDIEKKHFFCVDLQQLLKDEDFKHDWLNFDEEIINSTDICLCCIGLAMHQIILEQFEQKYNVDTSAHKLPLIKARLTNIEPVLMIKDLKVVYYEKLVAVCGTVIRIGNSQLQCQYMTFKCNGCGGSQVVQQKDGIYTSPTKCLTGGCGRTANFVPLLYSSYTRTLNYQNLKLQELTGSEQNENGRLARTIECDLTEDLVNFCNPGDDVIVTGILKIRNSTDFLVRHKQSSVFQTYLDVISIVNEKNENRNGSGSAFDFTFSTKDYYAIKRIHAEPAILRLLVHSLCPKIFGYEIVKAGLILALFGGTKNNNGIRSDSHVLIVGDPGLGKSQLLKACSNVAPRGIYVCGNTSTNSGLTVTMTRESGGEFALEAGALILADKGCCCIDEFDKMPTQHACLLEVMEQQSISISKAGVVCSLPAQATVLAAANPVAGHYNKGKTVSENLKISSPMLSRFDLIFILLDQPNEEQDKLLSEHIMALHGSNKASVSSSYVSSTTPPNYYKSLKEKLKLQPGEELELLPHELQKMYIAYAQKYVHPKLSDEAKEILKKFYLNLRKQHQQGNSTPITNRQLEAMRRLVQARAKLELREIATAEDAVEVVEIIKNCLQEVFTDDISIVNKRQNVTGMSTKKQVHAFLGLLQRKTEEESKSTFGVQELKMLSEASGIAKEKFYNVLQSLNIQGFLLKKSGDNYQLVSSDLS